MSTRRNSAKASSRPATPLFAIAPIERARGFWIRAWPFQSAEVLVTTFCLVGFSLWALVALWADLGALSLSLIGCFIGSMYFGPCNLLPARMTITTRREARCLVDEVEQLILRKGYMADESAGTGHVRYCRQWYSPLSKWFAWKELEIDLRWSSDRIELRGPVILVEWLRYRLIRDLAE